MAKFTCLSFVLPLDKKKVNVVEENHWFSDQFFTKYTFPIEFLIDEDLDVALNMITHINSAVSPKTFNGFLEDLGDESDAVMVISRIVGKKATGNIRFGFEEFPNFDTPLSELPLQRFLIAGSMPDYALGIIGQTYPAVNFNFPQVIIDSLDTSSTQWSYFEGLLNNYQAGAFLLNEYDVANDEQINRNIMQPFPYILHILKAGFADKGLQLTGDILEDPEFKKAVLVMRSEFYSTVSPNSNEFVLKANEYTELENIAGSRYSWVDRIDVGRYSKTLLLQEPGIYKIAGTIYLRQFGFTSYAQMTLNQEEIFYAWNYSPWYYEHIFTIDKNIEISVAQGAASLNFASFQLPYEELGDVQNPEGFIVDLTITKISGFDAQGNRTPSLITPKEINLAKCVPDITFGDLLKVLKNWKNYDPYINLGKGIVEMNKIQNEMENGDIVDLSDNEVKEPIREFFQDQSFVLKFQDVTSEEYKFDTIYVDVHGARTTSYVKEETTTEIIVNALPLPIKQVGTVKTGHLFIDSQSQVFVGLYDGLTDGLNLCKDPSNLLMPAVYSSSWREWINFRILAEGIEWNFLCDPETAGRIRVKSRISAYGKNLLIKRISRVNVTPNYYEITLECFGTD